MRQADELLQKNSMNNRADLIAFDQYQRYQTVVKLISFHRSKDLLLFLENDESIFTDIVLTEK